MMAALLEWLATWVEASCGQVGVELSQGKVSARKGASLCALTILAYCIATDLIYAYVGTKHFGLINVGLSAALAGGSWFVFYVPLRFIEWRCHRSPDQQAKDNIAAREPQDASKKVGQCVDE
ncbi:hypothetical protein THUN1379_12100 [Paludibacterium sp. THUN1379]|uniref:hypothetical protein n=1 Tax=Paludibacterium sp. THUN1379 TaxID=3112107 RepID=UPI003089EB9E|nr:hypothetical protein THUN1379_12100 [Paludibacterium sp. THUN1379]